MGSGVSGVLLVGVFGLGFFFLLVSHVGCLLGFCFFFFLFPFFWCFGFGVGRGLISSWVLVVLVLGFCFFFSVPCVY